jgi:hypothetical protein
MDKKIYLKNDICEFEPLKAIDYNTKKDIIVTSLFKMKSGGYKNFNKYLNGIKILSDIARQNNIEVRIFIDSTIKNDKQTFDFLNNFDNVTLILFKCSDFLKDEHHIGLFGTMVRFFPLFDFPNNDANIVFLADSDTKDEYIGKLIELYNVLKENNALSDNYLAYNGRYFHVNISSNKIRNMGTKKKKLYLPYCIAQKFFGIKRLPIMPFIKYFHKLLLYMNDVTRPTKILSDYHIEPDKYKIKCENNICFGVDEYFINNILFKYMVKKNIQFCYSNNYNLAQFYFFKHPENANWDLIDIPKEEYINIFNEYIEKSGLNQYSYDEIDKQIFIDEKNSETSQASEFMSMFAKKFIPVLEEIKKKKDYRIYARSQIFSMTSIDYKKYFRIRYIKFINSNKKNLINDYVVM